MNSSKRKRLAAALVACTLGAGMSFGLVACGDDDEKEKTVTDTQVDREKEVKTDTDTVTDTQTDTETDTDNPNVDPPTVPQGPGGACPEGYEPAADNDTCVQD